MGANLEKLTVDTFNRRGIRTLFEFDTEDRSLLPGIADAHQSSTEHVSMGIEDRFTGYAEQGLCRGDDPVSLAPTEPDTALCVAITQISDSVVKALAVCVDDLAKGR